MSKVVIIGGGLIGTACAYYLSDSGWDVTIIERGEHGKGTSGGNCGLVCPSHVLPLAEPGVIGKTVKALFARNSPFSIKPRLDASLWSWLFHFARRCNERDMMEAARGIQPLLESSLAEYRRIIELEAMECEWERRGLLFAYRSSKQLDAFAATDRLLGSAFHCPARRLDGAALEALEPALRPGLAGGWYYEDDAHLRPDKLMSSWRRVLEARGVTIVEQCELRSILGNSTTARAIETTQGELSADAFVVATGALTPLLNTHLGCKIPIQPGKGYSLTMPRPAICPRIPMIFPETRVAVTPFQTGYRLGSIMEFSGYDTSLKPSRLQLLKTGAEPYLREPYRDPIEQEWYGWRPMTYDSLPIIDRSPRFKNVHIAAGHNMLGLSMAPATGKLVAQMLDGRTPFLDPRPYGVGRF
ncbi:MAG: dadA1 [Planctomycetota bacterium]|nr:dadA1 [Planctomycetota bacterium]